MNRLARRGPLPANILALGRMKVGEMNKTEAAYRDHLYLQKVAGEIVWFEFEPWKLRLADNTFLIPDFGVIRADGAVECHDVKGHWMEDARVKMKVAAERHPFRIIAVTRRAKKDGGGWAVEDFSGEPRHAD